MIVKDEEEFLPRCLSSAKEAVDEIIVVDTGSTDRTMEIARDFGARVIEAAWVDDFSAVRNIGLEPAGGDWILYLDADEELEPDAVPLIREAVENSEFEGYMLNIVNLQGEDPETATETTSPSPRLFRNKPRHRFRGIIHEQVTFDESKSGSIGMLAARVRHYGYLEPVKTERQKSERNQELLKTSDWSEERTLVLAADEELEQGKVDEALEKYLRAYDHLIDKDLMHLPGIVLKIIYIHRVRGRREEALDWAAKGLARWPDYTDLEYLRALTHFEAGDYQAAIVSFMACILLGETPSGYDSQEGVALWRAFQGLGLSYLGLNNKGVAAQAFMQALHYNNRDAISAGNLGELYLSFGHDPAVVKTEMSKLVDAQTPEINDVFQRLFG